MKIGIINYHGDFTQIIKNIVPDNHEFIIYDMDATDYNYPVDIICASFSTGEHKKLKVKFLVLPYNTPAPEEIEEINNNPLCIGILDMSSILKQKFTQINKPVWAFTPAFPELPTYKESGTKVISLVNRYKERFPKEYEIAKRITGDLYGFPDKPMDDIAALKDAKWLLHLKPQGFVCNAVLKALACGIPVITDPETHTNLCLEELLKHEDNGIVLPTDQIKNYLDTVDEATYSRIKANCVAQSDKFKHPEKWKDGWWEQPAQGGFIPSVMGGVVRAAPYFTTAAMIQGSRLIQNNKERMASRRRPRSRRRHTRRAKRTYRRRATPRR